MFSQIEAGDVVWIYNPHLKTADIIKEWVDLDRSEWCRFEVEGKCRPALVLKVNGAGRYLVLKLTTSKPAGIKVLRLDVMGGHGTHQYGYLPPEPFHEKLVVKRDGGHRIMCRLDREQLNNVFKLLSGHAMYGPPVRR